MRRLIRQLIENMTYPGRRRPRRYMIPTRPGRVPRYAATVW